MLGAAVAFLFGLIFLLVGIAVHLRARTGNGPLGAPATGSGVSPLPTFLMSKMGVGEAGCTSQDR